MMNKKVVFPSLLISILTLVLLSCGTKEAEFDWPRWRGPNGDGISRETDWDPKALNAGPKILWRREVGEGHSNVVIRNNRLYTMGMTKQSTLYCLHAESGKLIWQYPLDSTRDTFSTPVIDGNSVYALFKRGILICVNAKNGKLKWKKDIIEEFKTEMLTYGYAQSPVIVKNLVLLNINTTGIALNKRNGELVWTSESHDFRLHEGYYATPVLYEDDGQQCALLFSGRGLVSVNVKTGTPLWIYEWMDRVQQQHINAADPVYFDSHVFLSTCNVNETCALLNVSGTEPKVVWQNENLKNYFSSSVLLDGYLYGSDGVHNECHFRCVEWNSGRLMWEKELRFSSLTAANGKLIILEENGILHIAEANPTAFQEISSCQLPSESGRHIWWTPPVLYRGKLYCRNWAYELICIDVSK